MARAGDMLIGGAGSGNEIATGLAWMTAHVDHATQRPRTALADMRRHILDTTERVGELKGLDSHYLMVGPGGILVLGSDGGISETPPRWAIGCGEDVGLGAMFRRHGSPAEVVRVAVEAACALREGCFGEAVVLASREEFHTGENTHWVASDNARYQSVASFLEWHPPGTSLTSWESQEADRLGVRCTKASAMSGAAQIVIVCEQPAEDAREERLTSTFHASREAFLRAFPPGAIIGPNEYEDAVLYRVRMGPTEGNCAWVVLSDIEKIGHVNIRESV